jgi:hypothetical protein
VFGARKNQAFGITEDQDSAQEKWGDGGGTSFTSSLYPGRDNEYLARYAEQRLRSFRRFEAVGSIDKDKKSNASFR